jgi:hypothetical protein
MFDFVKPAGAGSLRYVQQLRQLGDIRAAAARNHLEHGPVPRLFARSF